jgi:hypothetical protein
MPSFNRLHRLAAPVANAIGSVIRQLRIERLRQSHADQMAAPRVVDEVFVLCRTAHLQWSSNHAVDFRATRYARQDQLTCFGSPSKAYRFRGLGWV